MGRGPAAELRGWILDPDVGPFDEVGLLVDGEDAGRAEQVPAPGLGRSLPWVRGTADAGLVVRLDPGSGRARRLELLGLRDGERAGRYGTLLRTQADTRIPVPPPAIASPSSGFARRQDRDAGGEDERWSRGFIAGGLAAAANLLDRIDLHRGGPAGLRLLDWGCGCGRVVRHMLDEGFGSITGCDIDRRAISWCEEHIPGADFQPAEPEPPLPLEDASVDVVIGCSVATHLDASAQARWLAELRRVTAPGGLVLLSTQGSLAYRRSALSRARVLHRWPAAARLAARRLSRRLESRGIVDRGATGALRGMAPRGYYRSVAQSPDYTRHAWARHFEVLDCIERGLDGNQDLVVMRRR